MEKENKKCFIGLKIKKLPFLTISMLLLGLLIYGYFFTGFFKTKVKILENYDFDKGNWVLMKGIYGDSVQYIITDVNVLNKLKEDWVLYKTEKEFATTGGYNVALYSDKGRMMIMDIINDGWLSRQKSDILYSSDYETLGYSDLNWLDDCSSS